MGTGGGAGKVNVQDLSFTKYVDLATPTLIQAACKGTHFKTVDLTVRKAGDRPLEYIKIQLKEVIISSVSTGGSGGEDRLTEIVTLNFAEFKLIYTQQAKGGGKDASPEVSWNIPTNSTT
jgi:type VI secretion system secreted protein Hcp